MSTFIISIYLIDHEKMAKLNATQKVTEDELAKARAEVKALEEKLKEATGKRAPIGKSAETDSKCQFCDDIITPQNMARHISTVHKKEKRFECDLCGQKFTTKKNKTSHEKGCDGTVA